MWKIEESSSVTMQPEGSKYEETKDSFFYQVFGRKTREKSCFSFMNRVIYPVYRMFRKIIGLLYLYSNAFLFCGVGISLALERAAPMAPVRIVEEIISHTALIPTKVQMKTITFFPPISP